MQVRVYASVCYRVRACRVPSLALSSWAVRRVSPPVSAQRLDLTRTSEEAAEHMTRALPPQPANPTAHTPSAYTRERE